MFDRFDPAVVANYDATKVAGLMQDAGIIRNRLKIAAAVSNARAFLQVQAEFGSFDKYLWSFVGGQPVTNPWRTHRAADPHRTVGRVERGFIAAGVSNSSGARFVMRTCRAIGMVNDHEKNCFRHRQVAGL